MTRIAKVESKPFPRTGIAIGAVLVVVIIAGAILAAKPKPAPGPSASAVPSSAAPSSAPSRSAGALAARETNFDFGPVSMAAGKVSHRYWFRNASDAPVLIRRIYTSCMCTTATLVKGARIVNQYGMPGHGPVPRVDESMGPSEAAYLDVVFDPAAHGPAGVGPTERAVTIESDAGEPLVLGFTALVRP